jgi:hypothetical protein
MSVLARLQREGVRRGLFGTSRAWTAIAVGSFTLRQLKKLAKRDAEVVHCQELKPGESILISHTTDTHG